MSPIHDPQSLIRRLEETRYTAALEPDLATFEGLCHPQLVYSHSGGNRDSRTEYLDKLRTGALRYRRIEHDIDNILIIGDTALVFGQMSADVTVNGTDKTINNRSLAVWVQDAGNWKFAAYQPTPSSGG
ncbi:nuclear transport factor 2 family protein [Paenarthrobacter sp. JL.01a]|uniref:nuclear transport factor 2 family protein n=1 Tax=Paenarthrobacter sp. JL.01a TaxID=2979324 RepID=UPI0021C996F1|nr:nuclear transport factor 2 family protein [Paenarthrobacter sp. JL.01a]UXM92504.1 nuclear transport factor 2 family protein [Paenarthrobacter sp. JL.01a]